MASTYYSSPSPAAHFALPTALNSKTTINGNSTSSYSPAVSRSTELLSCARTALKIAKSQAASQHHQPWFMSMDPSQLRLHRDTQQLDMMNSEISSLLEDGLSLLRAMESGLCKLQGLVRRRGHVNDPTNEIELAVRHLETDAKELADLVASLKTIPSVRTKSQHYKHLELVAQWLQSCAAHQTSRLKEILKVRGNVLADQAQRRKLLNPSNNSAPNSSSSSGVGKTVQHHHQRPTTTAAAAPTARRSNKHQQAFDSPLFTMTDGAGTGTTTTHSAPPSATTSSSRTNTTTSAYGSGAYRAASSTTSAYYGGYNNSGSGYYGGGYGGGSSSMGMRHRRAPPAAASGSTTASHVANNNNNKNDDNDDVKKVQAQLQIRQHDRQTASRLESARQTEQSLAELGTLFGKMSSLISTQGETLEKIEDDVEAALGDVTDGQEEIQKLYVLKKGNRALILKVFGIVIFFIIFMRLY